MTQHNPPTDAELSEIAEGVRLMRARLGYTHQKWTVADACTRLSLRDAEALLAEVRRLRAAPLGYDAALRVADAVREACAAQCREGCASGGPGWSWRMDCAEEIAGLEDLSAIVRATLGDDAVARAEREVVEAALTFASGAADDAGSERLDALCDAASALRRAREEAGKR